MAQGEEGERMSKLEEIERIDTEYKTIRKFSDRGTYRLNNSLFNFDNVNGTEVMRKICERIDCNFHEVMDAINRTTR